MANPLHSLRSRHKYHRDIPSLPSELKSAIVQELYEPRHWLEDAAWAKPYRSLNSYLSLIGTKHFKPSKMAVPGELSNDIVLTCQSCASIVKLHQVSRVWNEICTPFLHQELDIHHVKSGQGFIKGRYDDSLTRIMINPEYVRSVRIHLGNPSSGDLWSNVLESIVLILSQCTKITKLALYYEPWYGANYSILSNQIVRMLERGTVRFFGLYSTCFMSSVRWKQKWDSEPVPNFLFNAVFGLSDCCRYLKRVEIAMDGIEGPELSNIQHNLSSIRSLTIVRAWKEGDFDRTKWASYQHLTRLHLAYCNLAHANVVVDLVGYFQLLEELVWDVSGDANSDSAPGPPKPGWSDLPTALHKTRNPLRSVHFEHALDWELCVLAQIPAVEVTIAHSDETRVENVLNLEDKSFFGMKALRVLPYRDRSNDSSDRLEDLCNSRKVVLLRDAMIHYPCVCCHNPYI